MSLPVIVLALSAICWSLWVRRQTWTCKFETAITLSLALMATGLLFVSPPAKEIGLLIEHLTGQLGIAAFIGHGFIVTSVACLVWAMLSRFDYGPELKWKFSRWVVAPAIIGATIRFTLLVVFDFHLRDNAISHWERAYWVLLAGGTGYLLAYAIRALLILRTHTMHKGADLYLLACMSGFGGCLLVVVNALTPTNFADFFLYREILQGLGLSFIGGLASATAVSWRRNTHRVRHLRAVA